MRVRKKREKIDGDVDDDEDDNAGHGDGDGAAMATVDVEQCTFVALTVRGSRMRRCGGEAFQAQRWNCSFMYRWIDEFIFDRRRGMERRWCKKGDMKL